MNLTVDEIERALAENAALLVAIGSDLCRMPKHKRGTKWHTDRLAEEQRLVDRRDMLRSQLRVIAECQSLDPFARAEAEDADWLNRGSL
jgi:hypothetical protein